MGMEIPMLSPEYQITGIIKKTQAEGFKDFAVGDRIQMGTVMKDPGRGSKNRTYNPVYTVYNLTQGTKVSRNSQTLLLKNLEKFNFEIKIV